ncbi:MAG: hypothetical protein J07HQW2_03026 [Haloquadratum walsbyi J07HQW2]|uniref:Uncharacterized protein n=1 Tax=Haloquadratum walsbyi J07HQW2 TaxID=1238425 RepID=U1PVV1_9EURY|nr:MAG: hypothetical protein J07HQW2_03026 [Haloquadratum walsbyi J07HQW2]
MILVPASLALKLIMVTISVSNTSTVVTPLRSILRVYSIHEHVSLFGLVFDTLLEFAKRPF